MNKKLNRLLRPHMGVYFTALGGFSALAMLMEQYWLGAIMAGSALLLYALYHLDRNYRRRELQNFLQKAENTLEASSRGDAPFPELCPEFCRQFR